MRIDSQQLQKAIFYGRGVQRYTQDSPIMPDVWIEFGERPNERGDVLLNPYLDEPPGLLCNVLLKRLDKSGIKLNKKFYKGELNKRERRIAYNQSTVVARLYFDELIQIVLPMTKWWNTYISDADNRDAFQNFVDGKQRENIIRYFEQYAIDRRPPLNMSGTSISPDSRDLPPSYLLWLIRVVGAINYVRLNPQSTSGRGKAKKSGSNQSGINVGKDEILDINDKAREIVEAAEALLKGCQSLSKEELGDSTKELHTENPSLIWSVNLNRPAQTAVWLSVPAVKADAARRLFDISCKHLCWAIVDSGIDATHPAFYRRDEGTIDGEAASDSKDVHWRDRTRVVATYDFTIVRNILSPDPYSLEQLPPRVRDYFNEYFKKNVGKKKELKNRLQQGRAIDWDFLLPYLEVSHFDEEELKESAESDAQAADAAPQKFKRPYDVPKYSHGTHVAGILAADWPHGKDGNRSKGDIKGMCPDIRLYDLRVLGEDGTGDEFAVLAAMQFIRHLNSHKETRVIHGINLSLCISHRVRNYACGCTPVCEESERMVSAGVVVVAAAGNEGYLNYLRPGDITSEGYNSISITDPGNAEAVITVGATHRDRAHTYGVSFFSSRGPTGDGRLKPDLVAPGEKITSAIPGRKWDTMDGTSMAAPHVSGAAALLLARYQELIGRPARLKQILCDTATDLGRERYFQGRGMIDILRAMQSI
jgi:serine protease AprX